MNKRKKSKKGYKYTCPITPAGNYTKLKNGKPRICAPEHKITISSPSPKDIEIELKKRSSRVSQELTKGLGAIQSYPKTVTFFGSSVFKQNHPYYKKARYLASHICRLGYAVVTGGGPGIMEAGNRGTNESCGSAVGFGIELPNHQLINPYVTHGVNFHYFFTRKVSLAFSAEVYVFFPGGLGTFDELFEILNLIKTQKIEKVPVVLIGTDFWNNLDLLLKETLLKKFGTIESTDLDFYKITDDLDEVLGIIETSKIRTH